MTTSLYSELGDGIVTLAEQTATVIDAVVTKLADDEREFADRAVDVVQKLNEERAALAARNEAVMTALLGDPPAVSRSDTAHDGTR